MTVDRDLAGAADDACFDKIELKGERTLEITYRKDQVNAGQVLAAVQRDGSASTTCRPARPISRTCSCT